MPKDKELQSVKQLLDIAEANIRQARSILFASEVSDKARNLAPSDGKFIEGVFNGESMVGPNDKIFTIAANYASKSKLVAGDVLKLSILEDGSFVYKQIGPVERKKLVGILEETADGKFIVTVGSTEYCVLPASITYFKAKVGDKLTILVPENGTSEWAAVENLLES